MALSLCLWGKYQCEVRCQVESAKNPGDHMTRVQCNNPPQVLNPCGNPSSSLPTLNTIQLLKTHSHYTDVLLSDLLH